MTAETRAAVLTSQLRAWLRARTTQPPDLLASVVAYELVALVAKHVETEADAVALIDRLVLAMKDQICTFGVGVEHP